MALRPGISSVNAFAWSSASAAAAEKTLIPREIQTYTSYFTYIKFVAKQNSQHLKLVLKNSFDTLNIVKYLHPVHKNQCGLIPKVLDAK